MFDDGGEPGATDEVYSKGTITDHVPDPTIAATNDPDDDGYLAQEGPVHRFYELPAERVAEVTEILIPATSAPSEPETAVANAVVIPPPVPEVPPDAPTTVPAKVEVGDSLVILHYSACQL